MSRRSKLGLALAAALFGCVGSARAQVIYEPVRYQYGTGNATFYYGGHDPRMFDHAVSDIDRTRYSSAVTQVPVVQRARIYSDVVPYQDVAEYSYTTYSTFTAADARNEAYANVPRYFRKRDLLMSRDNYVADDGAFVVPAHAEPRIEIRVVRPFHATTVPALKKGDILIIPKKVDPKAEKAVASAE
jgi:hypothetical protein